MNPSLKTIFDQVEQKRFKVIDLIKDLPAEKYMYSPGKDQWSIAQVLTHLLTAEALSIGYMKKKMNGIDQLQDSGLGAAFRFQILKISQRIPSLKFKAPKVVVENTPPALPLQEVVQKWDVQREELKALLTRFEEKHIKKLVYKHPFAGRLNACQAVAFLGEHIHHHMPQLERLIKLPTT